MRAALILEGCGFESLKKLFFFSSSVFIRSRVVSRHILFNTRSRTFTVRMQFQEKCSCVPKQKCAVCNKERKDILKLAKESQFRIPNIYCSYHQHAPLFFKTLASSLTKLFRVLLISTSSHDGSHHVYSFHSRQQHDRHLRVRHQKSRIVIRTNFVGHKKEKESKKKMVE